MVLGGDGVEGVECTRGPGAAAIRGSTEPTLLLIQLFAASCRQCHHPTAPASLTLPPMHAASTLRVPRRLQ